MPVKVSIGAKSGYKILGRMLIILLFCCDYKHNVYILIWFVNRKEGDMQQDFNAFCGKRITSVCDGYEPFVLAQMAAKERPLIYIASNGNSLAQTASMLRITHPELIVLEFPACAISTPFVDTVKFYPC
jgi:hypothetical protein